MAGATRRNAMSTTERTFDASRYLTKLRGQDYLEVKWRLVWLRTEHPDAIIETELIHMGEGVATFKARVALPGGGEATGWGTESADDFRDYLEKAETKALGRALAALGFGTQFCEDFAFDAEQQGKVVDSPVDRERIGARGGHGPANGAPERGAARPSLATPAQVNAIYVIGRNNMLSNDEVDERCRQLHNAVPAELTKRQASEFIDELKSLREAVARN